MVAAWFGAKVGVEGQESINAACRRSEVLGHDVRCLKGNPPEVLIDFLQRRKNEFLRFLEITIRKVREHLPDFIEVYGVGSTIHAVHSLNFGSAWAGNCRSHFVQISPRRARSCDTKCGVDHEPEGEYMNGLQPGQRTSMLAACATIHADIIGRRTLIAT